MPHAEGTPAFRQAGVSFRVGRLRELLKTKNVTESCPEPPFILREPQDERRVEGDDTGIVACAGMNDENGLSFYSLTLCPMRYAIS